MGDAVIRGDALLPPPVTTRAVVAVRSPETCLQGGARGVEGHSAEIIRRSESTCDWSHAASLAGLC